MNNINNIVLATVALYIFTKPLITSVGSKILACATPEVFLATAAVGIGIALGRHVIRKHVPPNQITDKILQVGKAVLTRLPFSSSVAKAFYSRRVGSNLVDGMGKVVFLPQTHWVSGMENNLIEFEKCWYAQLKIAEYLQSNPDDAVFEEGVSETMEEQPYPWGKSIIAFSLFPKGIIPSEDDSWTFDQKRFLAENGAAKTLCLLRKIKTVYRSIDPQNQQEIYQQMDKELAKGNSNYYADPLYSLVFTQREAALVEEVRIFLNNPKNKGRKVNMIFGHGHDFSKYFKPGSIMRYSGFISLEELNEYVKYSPGNIAYRFERANYLFYLGRWEEALSDYNFVHDYSLVHFEESINFQAKEKIAQIKRMMASERNEMLKTGNTVKHVNKSQSHLEFDHVGSQIKPGTTLIFDDYFKNPSCYQKMNVPRKIK